MRYTWLMSLTATSAMSSTRSSSDSGNCVCQQTVAMHAIGHKFVLGDLGSMASRGKLKGE